MQRKMGGATGNMNLIDHDRQPVETWRPGVETRMRFSALNGASALTVFEQFCAPGLGAPMHWHEVEEVLTVLSGMAEITVAGEVRQAGAGHSVLIPARRRHGFRNAGPEPLHMLAILAAPVFEAQYDDSGETSQRWDRAT